MKVNGKAGWLVAGGGIPAAFLIGWIYTAGQVTAAVKTHDAEIMTLRTKAEKYQGEQARTSAQLNSMKIQLDRIESTLTDIIRRKMNH